MAEPRLVGFDIETDTTTCGLDPELGAVVAVAVSTPEGDHVLTGGEADLLLATDRLLSAQPPGLLVTWNGAAFDLPYLRRRAELLGLPLALAAEEDPTGRSAREPERVVLRARWGALDHLDGYRLYRGDVGRTLGISCGLKPLARLVGLQPVELDRTSLHLAGAEELAAYVASDARTAVELVRRRMPVAARHADQVRRRAGAMRDALAAVHPATPEGP